MVSSRVSWCLLHHVDRYIASPVHHLPTGGGLPSWWGGLRYTWSEIRTSQDDNYDKLTKEQEVLPIFRQVDK